MNIAIFTNILNPYRTAFFDRLANEAEKQNDGFRVYAMVGEKSDRPWKYEEFKKTYTRLLASKTLHIKGVAYLHFNNGIEAELKEFKPDVVVMAGSYLQPTNLFLLSKKKKYGYKTVFWSESHFAETRNYGKFKLWLRETIRRKTLSKMDAFWYPGRKAEEFIDHYRSAVSEKIQVPNTIDNNFFCNNIPSYGDDKLIKELFLDSPGGKIFFTPARLSYEKGILEFCEILQNTKFTNYVWLIAGEGPLEKEIRDRIAQYGLPVRLLGQKNQNEIKKLYDLCDIFLLPSKSDSNPLTVIEALWSRKPVFVSEHVGNYPEAVEIGKNGYVFSYNNKEEAIELFERVLTADTQWHENATAVSFSKAQSLFDIDVIVRNTLVLTKKLLTYEE